MNPNQQSVLGSVGDFFSDVGDVFSAVGNFFEFMLDPDSYVRIFYVVFGFFLVIGALRYGHS